MEKATFADIWKQFRFNSISLAEKADVNIIVVNNMIESKPVARWQAEYVLGALSQVIGGDYSLDTVEVVLYPKEMNNGGVTPTNGT